MEDARIKVVVKINRLKSLAMWITKEINVFGMIHLNYVS